jgi:excinuclease UvrABC ATPase subunit
MLGMRATLGCGGVVAVHVDVDIPLGVLTVVTGVAGSGKSSLIHGSLPRQDGVSVVDQSAIRGFRRNNPATYTGLLDPGPPSPRPTGSTRPYSARTPKACPNCKGIGLVYTDLAMMAGGGVRLRGMRSSTSAPAPAPARMAAG